MLKSDLHFSSCWKAEARDWTASCSTEWKVMEKEDTSVIPAPQNRSDGPRKTQAPGSRRAKSLPDVGFFSLVESDGYLCPREYFEEDRLQSRPISIHPGPTPLHLGQEKSTKFIKCSVHLQLVAGTILVLQVLSGAETAQLSFDHDSYLVLVFCLKTNTNTNVNTNTNTNDSHPRA